MKNVKEFLTDKKDVLYYMVIDDNRVFIAPCAEDDTLWWLNHRDVVVELKNYICGS